MANSKLKEFVFGFFFGLFKKIVKEEVRKKEKDTTVPTAEKVHPWRLCGIGHYWVSMHPLTVSRSEKNPDGKTTRRGHCKTLPSKKDRMNPEEIIAITEDQSDKAAVLPKPYSFGNSRGNEFDKVIGVWTQYWNDILGNDNLLDPDLVKVLILTESSFDPTENIQISKKSKNRARGLLQITDETIGILKNEKGELKDHLINLDKDSALLAAPNVAAGIRWLHHKKYLMEKRVKRKVSWEEAIVDYKGYTEKLKKGDKKAIEQISRIKNDLRRLKEYKKQ